MKAILIRPNGPKPTPASERTFGSHVEPNFDMASFLENEFNSHGFEAVISTLPDESVESLTRRLLELQRACVSVVRARQQQELDAAIRELDRLMNKGETT